MAGIISSAPHVPTFYGCPVCDATGEIGITLEFEGSMHIFLPRTVFLQPGAYGMTILWWSDES